jgi:hypothetical protein
MKIMPLIAELPPRPRPLAQRIGMPEAVSATVVSAQSAEVPSRLGHAAGTAIASGGPRPPASSRSTRAPSSSDSRAAITQPAVPAPTTTRSYSPDPAPGFAVRSRVMSLLRLGASRVATTGGRRITRCVVTDPNTTRRQRDGPGRHPRPAVHAPINWASALPSVDGNAEPAETVGSPLGRGGSVGVRRSVVTFGAPIRLSGKPHRPLTIAPLDRAHSARFAPQLCDLTEGPPRVLRVQADPIM